MYGLCYCFLRGSTAVADSRINASSGTNSELSSSEPFQFEWVFEPAETAASKLWKDRPHASEAQILELMNKLQESRRRSKQEVSRLLKTSEDHCRHQLEKQKRILESVYEEKVKKIQQEMEKK